MPDTPTLKPKWQLLLELLKSPAIIAVVTALVTIPTTLATQKALGAKPPVEKVTVAPIVEDKSGAILDELRELRRELLERLPPPKATKGKRR